MPDYRPSSKETQHSAPKDKSDNKGPHRGGKLEAPDKPTSVSSSNAGKPVQAVAGDKNSATGVTSRQPQVNKQPELNPETGKSPTAIINPDTGKSPTAIVADKDTMESNKNDSSRRRRKSSKKNTPEKNQEEYTGITLQEIRDMIMTSTAEINKKIDQQNAAINKKIDDQFEKFSDQILSRVQKVEDKIATTETMTQNLKERVDQLERSAEYLSSQYDQLERSAEYISSQYEREKEKVDRLEQRCHFIKAVADGDRVELVETRCALKKANDKITQVEIQQRSKNLIIDGLAEGGQRENTDACVRRFLTGVLHIAEHVHIDRCFRMTNIKRNPSPVMVIFSTAYDRNLVWSKRTELKNQRININEDFPQEVLEARRTLYPIFKEAQLQKLNPILRANKLIIRGATYSVHDLHRLYARYEDLRPEKIATKDFGNIVGFFSRFSPFSNFHPAIFRIDERIYKTVEHFYQAERARYLGKDDIADKIMEMEDPAKCKKEGDSIEATRDQEEGWKIASTSIMQMGLEAKYRQNDYLRAELMNTRGKALAEMSFNKRWGTGLHMRDRRNQDKALWTGENLLGRLQGELRDIFEAEIAEEDGDDDSDTDAASSTQHEASAEEGDNVPAHDGTLE